MKPGDRVWVRIPTYRRVIGVLVEEFPERGGWLVDVDGLLGGFGYSEIEPCGVVS